MRSSSKFTTEAKEVPISLRFGKMDMSYEECFADDESDISESSLSRDDVHNGQDIAESTADNECVFDTEWALKRRYSLSSLLYSRLLLRLKDQMKTALSS